MGKVITVTPSAGQEVYVVPKDALIDHVTTVSSKKSSRVVVAGTYVDPDAPTPPPPAPVPAISVTSSITGGILKGKVAWTAAVSDTAKTQRVEFYVDGVLTWTEAFAPYTFNGDPGGTLDTTTLSDGAHALAVRAFDLSGIGTLFAGGSVTVANAGTIPTPPPPAPGSSMPTDVPAGWKVLVAQDFDQDVAEGSWPGPYARDFSAYPKDWRDTARSQGRRGGLYDPAMISVKDGKMRVRFATIAGTRRIAVPTLVPGGVSNFTSGIVEYAIRVTNVVGNGHGYKTALLWWPGSNTWPRDGEIDFVEGDLDSGLGGFMHRQGATSGGDQYAWPASGKYTDQHVARLVWVGGQSCEAFLDGKSLGKTTTRVPNTPMHYVFQCETSLSSAEADDSTTGYIEFDWVRFLVPA